MKNYIPYFSRVTQKYFLAEMKMMNWYFCRSLAPRERVNEHNNNKKYAIFAYEVWMKKNPDGAAAEQEQEGDVCDPRSRKRNEAKKKSSPICNLKRWHRRCWCCCFCCTAANDPIFGCGNVRYWIFILTAAATAAAMADSNWITFYIHIINVERGGNLYVTCGLIAFVHVSVYDSKTKINNRRMCARCVCVWANIERKRERQNG